MAVKIGINGFGRIGRLVTRAAMADPDIEIAAVNDLADAKVLRHLFKYDSVHGVFKGEVTAGDGFLEIDGMKVQVLQERDPAALPWKALGVDAVLESTGLFTARDKASKHLEAGAPRVVISAPATDPDITVVMGVNEDAIDREAHRIISNASCTTNCLVPVVKVLMDSFGFQRGYMTTIHAYTNDQVILDAPHKDLRRARAAAMSIIPTTTGAARATGLVIPELKGKIDGMAMRVPTFDASVVDLVAILDREVTRDEVNAAMKAASQSDRMSGILAYTEDPIVSIDVVGSSYSSVFDAQSTMVMGDMVKVISWYDNEWGYSSRVVDLLKYVAS
ncbi:MAG: type I glyceraldehyde-3-phosphate dehydrogenase [Actinobacteria bacterium]|nr:type I glyceraldehyde-3-phosphate dehydrogenase [Actinomycetota bacterium]MBU1944691.1 type I glyceraldehyde-3-phosphate dehydrogenase [Actinomycetota bacterium]MBU2689239.1 type I glyceraldehyde-3-phosphate dehydrogenase [Actinomycetota bacterium]